MGYIDTGRSAKSISDANIAAEHGVLNAATNGSTAIQDALGYGDGTTRGALADANNNVNGALANANQGVGAAGHDVTQAATDANTNLQGLNSQVQSNLAPSIASGAQGNKSLQDYAASNPQFKFNYDDYKNDPAYQFQLEQGTNAISNQASAMGLSQGGGTLAALTQYGQGLAATHYNDAFNRAQSQFQTNQNTTLSNLQALISSGAQGNALSSQANQAFGGQESANTTNAAGTNANLQTYLGSLNTNAQTGLAGLNVGANTTLNGQRLQGTEAGAQLGLSGAEDAGNYAVGAGTAHAAGITGQGAALTSGVSDLAGLLKNLVPGLGMGG